MNQQKGFANIVLIVLVVVLVAVVGYFALVKKSSEVVQKANTPAPTNNQTAPKPTTSNNTHPSSKIPGWQTYRSEKYGFEVQYPQDWIVEDFRETKQKPPYDMFNVFSFVFQDSKLEQKQKSFYDRKNMFVGFQMLDPSPSKTTEERSCPSYLNCVTSYKTISGVKAIINTFEEPEGMGAGDKRREIEFIKDGKLFEFYTGLPQESISVLADKTFFIDQIAGTFGFTK